MNSSLRRKWADAIVEARLYADEAIQKAPNSWMKDDVVSDIANVEEDVRQLLELFRGRWSARHVARRAAALTAYHLAIRLALELPGLVDRDMWQRASSCLCVLGDASWQLNEYAFDCAFDEAWQWNERVHHTEAFIDRTPEKAYRSQIAAELRARVWAKTDGRCWYCGVSMNPFVNYRVDHYVAVVLGGTNDIDNLVPACHDCNAKKRDRTVASFRSEVGPFAFGDDQ